MVGIIQPRDYVLRATGMANALPKLRQALNELAAKQGQDMGFDTISWDGRNASLAWGDEAVDLIEEKVTQYVSGYPESAEAILGA